MVYSLALGAFLVSLFYAIKYCHEPIIEQHAFRQTQTALTTYWILRSPAKLAYETPVLGAPWSLPFEVPIYQYIVAFLVRFFAFDLQTTGRLVNYAFCVACVVPVGIIFKRLFADWTWYSAIFCGLFFTSPIYLFWGRTFMIEMAALFFALSFVAASIPLLQLKLQTRQLLFCAAALTLALLQKVTTVLPLCAIVLTLLGFQLWRNRRSIRPADLAALATSFGVPLAIGFAWVVYTDHVKSQSQMTAWLTSSQLNYFNYGSIYDRLRPGLYRLVFWNRIFKQNAGGVLGLAAIAIASVRAESTKRLLILTSLSALVLPFLLFEHLHVLHDYYQAAIAIFAIIAVSTALACPDGRRLRALSAITVVVIAVLNRHYFKDGYAGFESLQLSDSERTLAISKKLRAVTSPDESILLLGYDWSSEVPFFSQRRGLAVPGKFGRAGAQKILAEASGLVGSHPIGAVVYCPAPEVKNLDIHAAFPGFRATSVASCTIFSR